jgi:hypothetical protein
VCHHDVESDALNHGNNDGINDGNNHGLQRIMITTRTAMALNITILQ